MARARTDAEGKLKSLTEGHDHDPPNYHVTQSGVFVKLS